mmetsp:Transcript_3725/g.15233  ORF Transcript_3725/g.15233 Transcript_3725/m.15233 type:complete len:320 (-) Transcript_3725:274-1233(-)
MYGPRASRLRRRPILVCRPSPSRGLSLGARRGAERAVEHPARDPERPRAVVVVVRHVRRPSRAKPPRHGAGNPVGYPRPRAFPRPGIEVPVVQKIVHAVVSDVPGQAPAEEQRRRRLPRAEVPPDHRPKRSPKKPNRGRRRRRREHQPPRVRRRLVVAPVHQKVKRDADARRGRAVKREPVERVLQHAPEPIPGDPRQTTRRQRRPPPNTAERSIAKRSIAKTGVAPPRPSVHRQTEPREPRVRRDREPHQRHEPPRRPRRRLGPVALEESQRRIIRVWPMDPVDVPIAEGADLRDERRGGVDTEVSIQVPSNRPRGRR